MRSGSLSDTSKPRLLSSDALQEQFDVFAVSRDDTPAPEVASGATDSLFQSLYEDLRRLARREVRRNGAQHFVGTSTLVHEAWLDISKRPALSFDEPGRYPFVTHSFRWADAGALGFFAAS